MTRERKELSSGAKARFSPRCASELKLRPPKENSQESAKVGLMRPRYFLSLLSSLLFFLTPILHASEVKWPAKIGSFTLQQGTFKPDGTPSFLDPQLAGLGKESGFVNTTFKYYLSAKGGAKLILFTFKDSSGAYEARTFLQGIGGALSDVVHGGNLVLWIDGKSGASTADVRSLAE